MLYCGMYLSTRVAKYIQWMHWIHVRLDLGYLWTSVRLSPRPSHPCLQGPTGRRGSSVVSGADVGESRVQNQEDTYCMADSGATKVPWREWSLHLWLAMGQDGREEACLWPGGAIASTQRARVALS